MTKNPSAKKIIAFFGFCCKDRADFYGHDEDYFRTVIWLEEIAKKNNYVVFVRPRSTFGATLKYLSTKPWKSKYIDKYKNINKSKYIHFITTSGHSYIYFGADMFVVNGCSSIEIEACLINKPLILVRTINKYVNELYDPFDTIKTQSAFVARNKNDFNGFIEKCSVGNELEDNQNKLIASRNIVFDGKANYRILETLYKNF